MSDECAVNASPGGRSRLPTPQDWRRPVVRTVRHESFPHHHFFSLSGPRLRYQLSAEAGEKRVQGEPRFSPPVAPRAASLDAGGHLLAHTERLGLVARGMGGPLAGHGPCRIRQSPASQLAPGTRVLPPHSVRLAIGWRWQSNGRFQGRLPCLNPKNGVVT
jgi:hypothetical protein